MSGSQSDTNCSDRFASVTSWQTPIILTATPCSSVMTSPIGAQNANRTVLRDDAFLHGERLAVSIGFLNRCLNPVALLEARSRVRYPSRRRRAQPRRCYR